MLTMEVPHASVGQKRTADILEFELQIVVCDLTMWLFIIVMGPFEE